MKKMIAEAIGTFTLVLFGCGAAVLAGAGTAGVEAVGQLGIAFAFGLAIVAMAYGIGPISGCHVNPAVSFGLRFGAHERGRDDPVLDRPICRRDRRGRRVAAHRVRQSRLIRWAGNGLGANGWGPDYLGEYTLLAAFVFEVVATFIFLVVILGATQKAAPAQFAGLAIGLTLVLIHIVGIQVTGVSVNPARSFGPAVIVGGSALSQLWLFFVAP